MCIMDARTNQYTPDNNTNNLPYVVPINERGVMKWSKCGVCFENFTIGGNHNQMIFRCGHFVCLQCYNNDTFRDNKKCPFCRKQIDAAFHIWGEEAIANLNNNNDE